MAEDLTFDMIRAGLDQFEKIKREDYPPEPEYDVIYKSFLVGQIYQAMKEVENG
jgi:hypothetical protein